MKVLVIGSGGREHALTWKIRQSPRVGKLYAAPGNAGMAEAAECVAIPAQDRESLLRFARAEKIDLTVVGPEQPLCDGIADLFREEGLLVFGPGAQAARLEGSKAFSKGCMKRFGVPTAPFEIFSTLDEASSHLRVRSFPCVIKADGLAAGKGVSVAQTRQEAEEALRAIMERRIFGDAGGRVVIEDFLAGEELSILAFTDGKRLLCLASSQDHKRAYDGDSGPNTGGMGAYSPCPLISESDLEALAAKMLLPVIRGLASEGVPYTGLIYAGLMLTPDGPFVLEYNCRFGDPEAQAVLVRMDQDLVPLLFDVARGDLRQQRLPWKAQSSVTVVLASRGYPGSYETGFPICGLERLSGRREVVVFHAGTKRSLSGEMLTAGGRVLNVTALGENLAEAREKAYAAVREIKFEGMVFRQDIGKKGLEKIRPVACF